jgi:nucleotide-binding universal stress UspA family protein
MNWTNSTRALEEFKMKKNGVICAIDVNDYDPNVLDLAADFANRFGVALDLIHVTLFPDPTKAAWPAYVGAPSELIKDYKRLQKISNAVKSVEVHFHHLSGNPTEQILSFIRDNEPQLLVLGTHARHGLGRFLGSVALKVLRHAPCPVMVLRQRLGKPKPVNIQSE